MGRGAWWAIAHEESDMTEATEHRSIVTVSPFIVEDVCFL